MLRRSFFSRCSKVRDDLGAFEGTRYGKSRPEGVGREDAAVKELWKENNALRETMQKVESQRASGENAVESSSATKDDQDKYLIATIVTASLGRAEKDLSIARRMEMSNLRTPEALGELARTTADSLLSLELLWAPENGERWLTKDEVLKSMNIRRSRGYASIQSLDLYGKVLW